MYQHKTIEEFGAELDRQTAAKRDYVAPARKLTFTEEGKLAIDTIANVYEPTRWFKEQVAKFTDFPFAFFQRAEQENPAEWRALVNARVQSHNTKQLVRTLDGNARAFLSNGYFPVEHSDVAKAVIAAIGKQTDWQIVASEVTGSRMYMKVLTPLVKEFKVAAVNEPIQFGFSIRNSEIGLGAYEVDEFRYFVRCKNGAIGETMLRKVHVGSKLGSGGDDVSEFFSNRTRNLTHAALMSQTEDVIRAVSSPERADRAMLKLTAAAERPIKGDVVEVIQQTGKQFGLGVSEGKGVLDAILKQGLGTTQYALGNAITQMAQDLDSYDRRVELEGVGNQVLELDGNQWEKLLKAAS